MTAREYCKSHPVTAYDSSYGRCGGFQIHGDVQYGIDDYIYRLRRTKSSKVWPDFWNPRWWLSFLSWWD